MLLLSLCSGTDAGTGMVYRTPTTYIFVRPDIESFDALLCSCNYGCDYDEGCDYSCDHCGAGTRRVSGKCLDCGVGEYRNSITTATSCKACAAGQFAETTGASEVCLHSTKQLKLKLELELKCRVLDLHMHACMHACIVTCDSIFVALAVSCCCRCRRYTIVKVP